MNVRHTKELHDACPILYKRKLEFACGDGWFALIRDLSHRIEEMNNNSSDEKLQVTVMQVKEKFGGLRFYVDFCSDKVREMIDEAERMSVIVCEECGEKGELRREGWWRTLCDECDQKRKNN